VWICTATGTGTRTSTVFVQAIKSSVDDNIADRSTSFCEGIHQMLPHRALVR